MALPCFYALHHKQRDSRGGGPCIDLKICVYIFSTIFFSETFLILKIIQGNTAIKVRKCSRKILFSLVRF